MFWVANFRKKEKHYFFLSPLRVIGMLLGPGNLFSKDVQVTSSNREALLVTLKGPPPWMIPCGGWGGQVG